MNSTLVSAAAGALTMYFLDSQLGPRRRAEAQRLLQRKRLAVGGLGLILLLNRGLLLRVAGAALLARVASDLDSASLEEIEDRPLFFEEA